MKNPKIHFQTRTRDFEEEPFQTKLEGSLQERYEVYLEFGDDGHGCEIGTGKSLKTFDEWLSS